MSRDTYFYRRLIKHLCIWIQLLTDRRILRENPAWFAIIQLVESRLIDGRFDRDRVLNEITCNDAIEPY